MPDSPAQKSKYRRAEGRESSSPPEKRSVLHKAAQTGALAVP